VDVSDLTLAAVYDRTIAASVARIWENVLDWEHLPWLHRASFASVRLLDESTAGWRGWVTSRSHALVESLVEVELDRPALRYVTRTVDGEGAGGEILTVLEPKGERSTDIRVEFRLRADPDRAAAVGSAYVRLYTRLWDEDEAMMVRRQALIDENGEQRMSTVKSERDVPLGSLTDLRKRLPLVIRIAGRELRLVESEGAIRVHPTVCPHLGGPLAEAAVEAGCVTCPWHGYRYDLASGRCVSGPALVFGPLPAFRHDPQTDDASLTW
jgi:nitrite reductase/ring-hydroxylating ferredoxin subunit